jgi:hypothetical protein
MSRQLLIVCALCCIVFGHAIPIVISRYGGNSGRRRRQEMYALEERRWVNTCSVARAMNPHINIGKCPGSTDEYKKLFKKESMSFLDDYYRHRCDIVKIVEMKPNYFCAFLGTVCMTLASLVSVGCTIGLVKEIFTRIIVFV